MCGSDNPFLSLEADPREDKPSPETILFSLVGASPILTRVLCFVPKEPKRYNKQAGQLEEVTAK